MSCVSKPGASRTNPRPCSRPNRGTSRTPKTNSAFLEASGRPGNMPTSPSSMNKVGQGEPDLHDEHTNNLFLQTRGLPKPASGDQARYILERLADASRPFGTKVEVKGDAAEINLKGRS